MPNALIWGASGSIGSTLAKNLSKQDWTVYGAARNVDNIPAEVEHRYDFDATNPESFKETAIMLAEDAGSLDLVVYAAGTMMSEKLANYGAENWKTVLDANLNGAYLGLQSVLHLVPKGGHLVVIGAYVNKITLPKFGAYATAKAGLEPMMTLFQKENRRKHFTLVRPPAVKTPFWENVPFDPPDYAISPSDVAAAIIEQIEQDKEGTLDL